MRNFARTTALAVATTSIVMLAGAQTSGANAQETPAIDQAAQGEPLLAQAATSPEFVAEPIVQPLDPVQQDADKSANEVAANANSLAELVDTQPQAQLSADMRCLAGAIYFESKGEPLEGQLAVGRVIVNRAESSRFPDSYCGVVYQRSQFSFVRGGTMPAIDTSSRAWQRARAIARIAHEGAWDSEVEGALFFHARYVSPGWRLARVGQVKNHIFYR